MEWHTLYMQGPRWTNIRTFLFDLARATDIELEVTGHDKGLLRQTVFFRFGGEQSGLMRFIEALEQVVTD